MPQPITFTEDELQFLQQVVMNVRQNNPSEGMGLALDGSSGPTPEMNITDSVLAKIRAAV